MAGRTPSNDRAARLYAQHCKVLEQARKLAHTGAHADHTTILPCLETVEGFADALSKARVRRQVRAALQPFLQDALIIVELDGMRA
jgi:hypothetical protein